MLIDAARQAFNMQDITNRRFMYDPNTCALILGDQEAIRGLSFGSHAEDHGDSGAKAPFDSFVRGWVGTGEAYKRGVIHFAPPINGKNADRLIDGYNTLQMFRENGAVANTVVRGFPGAWEQPLSEILPGFICTRKKESEDRDMQYHGPYYGVWAVRGGGSVLGPAEAWSKYNGIPLVFTDIGAAERQATQYNENTASRNVHYYAKEMEPMVAQNALMEMEKAVAAYVESKEVYVQPAAYAKAHGELDIYRASNRLNRECAKAVTGAIKEHWDGSRVNPAGATAIIEQYGEKRIGIILANTVCRMSGDTRFSRNNRDWAEALPKLERGDEWLIDAHPVKLDSFIDAARHEIMERNSPERAADKTPARRKSATAKLEAAKQAVKPPAPKAPGKKNELDRE